MDRRCTASCAMRVVWSQVVVRDSGEVKTLRYRAVQELSDPGKTPAEDAKKILENIGLVLAGIVTFPLMLLAVLTGWDGR